MSLEKLYIFFSQLHFFFNNVQINCRKCSKFLFSVSEIITNVSFFLPLQIHILDEKQQSLISLNASHCIVHNGVYFWPLLSLDHINERAVCNAIAPEKDVDGFHIVNIGKLCLGQRSMVPATPAAVWEIIKRAGKQTNLKFTQHVVSQQCSCCEQIIL